MAKVSKHTRIEQTAKTLREALNKARDIAGITTRKSSQNKAEDTTAPSKENINTNEKEHSRRNKPHQIKQGEERRHSSILRANQIQAIQKAMSKFPNGQKANVPTPVKSEVIDVDYFKSSMPVNVTPGRPVDCNRNKRIRQIQPSHSDCTKTIEPARHASQSLTAGNPIIDPVPAAKSTSKRKQANPRKACIPSKKQKISTILHPYEKCLLQDFNIPSNRTPIVELSPMKTDLYSSKKVEKPQPPREIYKVPEATSQNVIDTNEVPSKKPVRSSARKSTRKTLNTPNASESTPPVVITPSLENTPQAPSMPNSAASSSSSTASESMPSSAKSSAGWSVELTNSLSLKLKKGNRRRHARRSSSGGITEHRQGYIRKRKLFQINLPQTCPASNGNIIGFKTQKVVLANTEHNCKPCYVLLKRFEVKKTKNIKKEKCRSSSSSEEDASAVPQSQTPVAQVAKNPKTSPASPGMNIPNAELSPSKRLQPISLANIKVEPISLAEFNNIQSNTCIQESRKKVEASPIEKQPQKLLKTASKPTPKITNCPKVSDNGSSEVPKTKEQSVTDAPKAPYVVKSTNSSVQIKKEPRDTGYEAAFVAFVANKSVQSSPKTVVLPPSQKAVNENRVNIKMERDSHQFEQSRQTKGKAATRSVAKKSSGPKSKSIPQSLIDQATIKKEHFLEKMENTLDKTNGAVSDTSSSGCKSNDTESDTSSASCSEKAPSRAVAKKSSGSKAKSLSQNLTEQVKIKREHFLEEMGNQMDTDKPNDSESDTVSSNGTSECEDVKPVLKKRSGPKQRNVAKKSCGSSARNTPEKQFVPEKIEAEKAKHAENNTKSVLRELIPAAPETNEVSEPNFVAEKIDAEKATPAVTDDNSENHPIVATKNRNVAKKRSCPNVKDTKPKSSGLTINVKVKSEPIDLDDVPSPPPTPTPCTPPPDDTSNTSFPELKDNVAKPRNVAKKGSGPKSKTRPRSTTEDTIENLPAFRNISKAPEKIIKRTPSVSEMEEMDGNSSEDEQSSQRLLSAYKLLNPEFDIRDFDQAAGFVEFLVQHGAKNKEPPTAPKVAEGSADSPIEITQGEQEKVSLENESPSSSQSSMNTSSMLDGK